MFNEQAQRDLLEWVLEYRERKVNLFSNTSVWPVYVFDEFSIVIINIILIQEAKLSLG